MIKKSVFSFFILVLLFVAFYHLVPQGAQKIIHQASLAAEESVSDSVITSMSIKAPEQSTEGSTFCFDRTEERNYKCPKEKIDVFTLTQRHCLVVNDAKINLDDGLVGFSTLHICEENPDAQRCPTDKPISFCYHPLNETCLGGGLHFDRYDCQSQELTPNVGFLSQSRIYSCESGQWTPWKSTSNSCHTQADIAVKSCDVVEEIRERKCDSDLYAGTIKEARKKICEDGMWSPWVSFEDNCTCKQPFFETKTDACNDNRIGEIKKIRTKKKSCEWGPWQELSNKCVENCDGDHKESVPIFDRANFTCSIGSNRSIRRCSLQDGNGLDLSCENTGLNKGDECFHVDSYKTPYCDIGVGYIASIYQCRNICENIECTPASTQQETRLCSKGLFGQAIFERTCDNNGRYSEWEYSAEKSTCRNLSGTVANCEPSTIQRRRKSCPVGKSNVVQTRTCDETGQFSAWSAPDFSACR